MLPCQYAYHAAKCLCDKLLECLWVEVGLRELGQLIEIRILAYLRVAKPTRFSRQNGYAMFIPKLGNLVYTFVLCASHSNSI